MHSSGRTHILIAGIFLFIIFIVWALLGSRSNSPAQPIFLETPQVERPVAQPVTPIESNDPAAATIQVSTKSGSSFTTPNFLDSIDVEQYDENVFLVAEEQSLNGFLYQIFFNRAGTISITLADEDLEFARQQAEIELRNMVPESDMRLCSLDVQVTVPVWLSQQLGRDYSGVDYGLSFCPGSLNFE